MTRRTESAGVPATELLRWNSGGWVVWLAGAMCLAVLVWRGSVIVSQLGHRAVGDGQNPATYGFDLSNLTISGKTLVGGGFCKDGIPALTDPPRLTIAEAAEFHRWLREEQRHKFIVGDDPVIGVVQNGEAMAYPTRILAWHQVVNDEVGGVPVLVTYDPLCDSSVVFSRRVEDETLQFGVSGLMLNSNLVLYDRRPQHHGESLWSQLLFGAIAGPAAGQQLEIMPFSVMPWREWSRVHPDTRVMKLDVNRIRVYKNTLGEYYGSDKLRFPVDPELPRLDLKRKAPLWAVRVGLGRWHYALSSEVRAKCSASGRWDAVIDGAPITFLRSENADAIWPAVGVDAATESPVRCIPAFRFAWYAHHPDSPPLSD